VPSDEDFGGKVGGRGGAAVAGGGGAGDGSRSIGGGGGGGSSSAAPSHTAAPPSLGDFTAAEYDRLSRSLPPSQLNARDKSHYRAFDEVVMAYA